MRAGCALSQILWHELQNSALVPRRHASIVRSLCGEYLEHRAHLNDFEGKLWSIQ